MYNLSMLSITTSKSVSTSLVGFHIHLFCHATKVVYDQLLGHAFNVFSKQKRSKDSSNLNTCQLTRHAGKTSFTPLICFPSILIASSFTASLRRLSLWMKLGKDKIGGGGSNKRCRVDCTRHVQMRENHKMQIRSTTHARRPLCPPKPGDRLKIGKIWKRNTTPVLRFDVALEE